MTHCVPTGRAKLVSMSSTIRSFHQDEAGEWVATLSCGHRQHVRHRPPFQLRAWVLDGAGRASRLGTAIECGLCAQGEPADAAEAPAQVAAAGFDADEGGEAVCLAPLVCAECGAVIGPDEHRPGCPRAG